MRSKTLQRLERGLRSWQKGCAPQQQFPKTENSFLLGIPGGLVSYHCFPCLGVPPLPGPPCDTSAGGEQTACWWARPVLSNLGGKQVCTISVLLKVAVDVAGTCAPFTGQLSLLSHSLTWQARLLSAKGLAAVCGQTEYLEGPNK